MKMIGIILGIVIPISYILIGSAVSRYVARTSDARDSFDTVMGAVLCGILWPLAFPFYIAIHGVIDR